MIRKFSVMVASATLVACGGGGGGSDDGGNDGGNVNSPCSVNGQKQFVLDSMQDWYLWNDLLPADVDINDFASPEDLLAYLTTFSPDLGSGSPVDRFSFINSAEADSAFFGEGQFEGFGFSSRFVATNDWRLTRVFMDSPAFRGGMERGQRIVALNGRTIADIEAAEGVNALLESMTLDFTLRPVGTTGADDFTSTITKDIVTIDPIPQWRIIPVTGTPGVGYLELATFISTADAKFDNAFSEFLDAGVSDVVIDMRYNGGGLVSTAELLGDYLGGLVAQNLLFSETRFNDDRAAANNNSEFFELRGNSMNLVRLYVIATRNTASASELVTNGLEPHVDVVIVGDNTFGKPVGQIGLEFCERILRPTAFQTVNANGEGDYFDGLPVDCVAADDLDVPVGDANDPNIIAALAHVETGACPVSAAPGTFSKPQLPAPLDVPGQARRPEREHAYAW